MKEEEGRRIAAVEAFHVAEKSNQELKSKLIEAERDKKVLKLPWTVLKGRPKVSKCFFARPRTSWPPPKGKLSP